MLIRTSPMIFRRRPAKARRTKAAPPPVQGPVLIGAGFDAGTGKLELEFDRDVSADGIVASAIIVNDPASGSTYTGIGGSVAGGIDVEVLMSASGPSSGSQTVLNAGAGNGIVSSDDGSPWAGVSELRLPFP